MSSYLEIAEQVLSEAREPLTPRQIMAWAYARHLVPHHLHGRTQHKTIQARISEDILSKREESAFFRPRPGQFFLRKFLQDASLPEEFRTPIAARRRTRDLLSSPALAISSRALSNSLAGREFVEAPELYRSTPFDAWTYVDPKNVPNDTVLVWSAAVVVKENSVLAYRTGRYRDDRDTFANKQTISFVSLVSDSALSLFSPHDLGIQESALRAAVTDLDIPLRTTEEDSLQIESRLKFFAKGSDFSFEKAIIAMVLISCPKWFEPVRRRLSLNDLRWIDLRSLPNNIEDYDPWSRVLWRQLIQYEQGGELRGLE